MKLYFFGLFFIALIFLPACGHPQLDRSLLPGRWSLREGFRENKASDMLNGIYFEFVAPDKVKTNITSEEEEGSFSWTGDRDLRVNVSQKVKFRIEKLTDNELVMTAKIMGDRFKFVLDRQAAPQ